MSSSAKTWCSDALHDLIGYSDSSLASYLTSIAKSAKSTADIIQVLESAGVKPVSSSAGNGSIHEFAMKLFSKCHPPDQSRNQSTLKTNQETHNNGKSVKSRLTHADMIQKASTYSLVEDDEGDFGDYSSSQNMLTKPTTTKSVVNEKKKSISSSSKKKFRTHDKKKEKRNKSSMRRRKTYEESSESSDSSQSSSEYQNSHKDRNRRSSYNGYSSDSDSRESDDNRSKRSDSHSDSSTYNRDRDLKERDEFVKRMQKRDSEKTKSYHRDEKEKELNKAQSQKRKAERDLKLARGETVIDEATGKELNIKEFRELSRREYLKKRTPKELMLLEQSIQDEQDLFGDMSQMTARERKEFELKKKILAMAKQRENDKDDPNNEDKVDGFYHLPDDYDKQREQITKAQKDSALLSGGRYTEDKLEKTEQELWEESQKNRVAGLTRTKKRRRTETGKNKANEEEDDKKYDFVFEEQVDFVMQGKTEGYDDRQIRKMSSQKSESASKLASVKLKQEISSSPSTIVKSSTSSSHQKILEGRKKLPVYPYREEFLSAVKTNQVLILCGETGSGKTTQLPQYLHEVGYSKLGKIGCTQPRRVAAMSVAARVAQEMNVRVGHEVGYSIRFENRTSPDTVIQYMTDGMLLREFLNEPDLQSYSCLVIDEAHERTLHTDILFGLVKDIVRFREDLRLIISSATLDAEKFSRYFDDASIFMIPGRMFPVDIYYTKAPEADYVDAAVVTVLQIHVTQPMDGDILVFLTGQEEIEATAEALTQRTRK